MNTKSLVVIPFNIPWTWSTDYTNQTAFELAKLGHVVICFLYCDNIYFKDLLTKMNKVQVIDKYNHNIYIYHPLYLIPFRRFKFIADLNLSLNLFLLSLFSNLIYLVRKCQKRIFWIFDPNMFPMYKYFGKKYALLYDCVDFYSVGNDKNIKNTVKNEIELCDKSTLSVANSIVLQKHLNKYVRGVKLVPQGFRIEGFAVKKNIKNLPDFKKPTIGFVGGINDRLDLSILYPLIKNNKDWNFVLWGPVQSQDKIDKFYWQKLQEILSFRNVVTGNSVDKSEIPNIISQFDIGIIPYDISQNFNKYCYPMKLFEYFYMGKPVVSTEILELKRFPDLVKIGKDYREWEKIINILLKSRWPKEKIQKEINLAKDNSWQGKVEKILELLKI